jgi:hypothetical protein
MTEETPLYTGNHSLLVGTRQKLGIARGTQAPRVVNSGRASKFPEPRHYMSEIDPNRKHRTEYGRRLRYKLAQNFKAGFARRIYDTNLRKTRSFLFGFQRLETVGLDQSENHYLTLRRIARNRARERQMHEIKTQNWSTHAPEQPINTLYYEPTPNSHGRKPVFLEPQTPIAAPPNPPGEFMHASVLLNSISLSKAAPPHGTHRKHIVRLRKDIIQ